MQDFQDQLIKIKNALKDQPRGLTILEISDEINVNRNSVAKYLQVLNINGQVEMKKVGTAKVYFLSKRIPSQSILDHSIDCVFVINSKENIIQVNDQFITQCPANFKREEIIGKNINSISLPLFEQTSLNSHIKKALKGESSETEFVFEFDNKKYYFNTKLIPSTFEDGTIGVTIFLDNITKRKIAEKSLRQRAEFEHLLRELTSIFIEKITHDKNLDLIFNVGLKKTLMNLRFTT